MKVLSKHPQQVHTARCVSIELRSHGPLLRAIVEGFGASEEAVAIDSHSWRSCNAGASRTPLLWSALEQRRPVVPTMHAQRQPSRRRTTDVVSELVFFLSSLDTVRLHKGTAVPFDAAQPSRERSN